jgi:3-hydroxyisobutyrate dehydrogenase-like beta-hydroxyacid dehydrogenase
MIDSGKSNQESLREMRIAVLGLGHVGLPTALGLAELGRNVIGARGRLSIRCRTTLEEGVREIYDTVHSAKTADFTAPQFNNQAVVRTFAGTAAAARSSLRILQMLADPDLAP